MLHLVKMLLVYIVTNSFLFSSYDERQDWLQKFLLEVLSSSWILITSFRFKMSLKTNEKGTIKYFTTVIISSETTSLPQTTLSPVV